MYIPQLSAALLPYLPGVLSMEPPDFETIQVYPDGQFTALQAVSDVMAAQVSLVVLSAPKA